MLQPTLITWILIIFGLITCAPLLYAQLTMLTQPHSQKTKDILIGKGEDWRDKSHFKNAHALAWVDWILFTPVFVASIIGVVLGQAWGYVLFAVAGAIMLYSMSSSGFLKGSTSIPRLGHWPTTLTFGGILSIGEQPPWSIHCFV